MENELIEAYLLKNPEIADNLKPGAIPQLVDKIKQQYVARAGILVNANNNLAVDVGDVVKSNSRDFLISRGTGKYVGRYSDNRSADQKNRDRNEFVKILTEYANRRPEKLVSEEPLRMLIKNVSEHMLWESDNKGSFTIVSTLNGIPIERHSPDQVFSKLARYQDKDLTRLEQMRLESKLRNQALDYNGFSLADMNDHKKKGIVDETINLLKKELFSIPTAKRLPSPTREDFDTDLNKMGAHEMGYSIQEKDWSLADKIKLDAFAEQRKQQAAQLAWEGWERYSREKTPEFIKSVYDPFSGIEY